MKRLSLFCLVLFASLGARAEWLTLTGSPGEPASSYVQVDPTTVQVDGSHRIVKLRLSLAQERTTKDGIRFRSFRARVNVDCEARNARYVSATYFGQPDFVGDPIAVRVFEADDVRPMTLSGAPRDLAGRTVNAACSVGGAKEPKEQREPKDPSAP
ncbi:surface-adhesin E family protein [Variovorax sp. H27-G14]|uniref:surface-adhesin E family protein n=1 Tax=Variovorax sp. H27-G14 TaxID=3111914 RepID=UPI0038FC433F